MRIKRGTLRSERQAGRVFVLLGQGQPTEQPTDRPGEPNALISQMQGTIDSLERRLEEAAERDRENRRIIVALTSRIPAIEAPSEERESSETVELIERIGEEDRLRACQGLVAIVGADGRTSYRHIDALGRDEMEDRLAAEWLEKGWLKQRVERRRKGAEALSIPKHLG
jgi:hypothetical protein